MSIDRVVVGIMQCNCYVVGDDDEVIVIDPGDEYKKIKRVIGNRKVIGIIITHNHFDHVGCVDNFTFDYDVKVFNMNNLKEGINKIGKYSFEVIYNPGHTDDSISIYFRNDKVMFVGDFLFRLSIGRTDLGGNDTDMQCSIEKIKKYDDDIVIYPGHGEKTTLGYEKEYNPFF